MKIVLILPRVGIYRYKTGAFLKFLRYSPLTLVTLASLVPKEINAKIEILDEGIEEIRKEKINADLIGITAITGASLRAYSYADYFRKKGITVVMGGVHATLMPEEAKKHADSIVVGPAYETWPKLLFDFKSNRLKNFYYAPEKINFDHVPDINRAFNKKKSFITVNITQAVFGCPNNCEFCVTPISCKGYFHRPIKKVINEIRKMPGKYVTFVDPSPIENIEYAKELYTEMIPLKKNWVGLATTRIVKHEDLMNIMQKSGCKGLLIGFESLTQSGNNGIKKSFNKTNEFYKLANELHKRGIAINGCFVHGLDRDDVDCFKRTLDFVMDAKIDLPRFTICTPFPGTPFFERIKKENRLLTTDWSLYDAQHVVFKPKRMSAEQLLEQHHLIWKNAYKFSSIFNRIFGSKSFLEFSILANFGYSYYSHKLPSFHTNRVLQEAFV